MNNTNNISTIHHKNMFRVLSQNKYLGHAFVVGGAVRDLLLGRPVSDLDLILPDAYKAAHSISNNIPGSLITLGEKRGHPCYRFVPKGYDDRHKSACADKCEIINQVVFDLQEIKQGGLQIDLANRDFTINAMALPLSMFLLAADGTLSVSSIIRNIIDPFGGMRDLKDGVLREVSQEIFQNDPLRLWRLWRLSAELGFQPEPGLIELLRREKLLCRQAPGERVSSELFLLLRQTASSKYILRAAECGLFEAQFPQMLPTKGCMQGGSHNLDVWDHSFKTLIELEHIINNLQRFIRDEESRTLLSNWLSNGANVVILKLSALFHDIAKPLVKNSNQEGKIMFYGHQKEGILLVEEISKQLRLSKKNEDLLYFLVEHHMQIHSLLCDAGFRARLRFWRKHGEDTSGLILLGCADLMAKNKTEAVLNKVKTYFSECIPSFLNIWRDKVKASEDITYLLNGNDIMKHFKLVSGQNVGLIKEAVREAQLAGEVNTREEALAYAAKLTL